MAGEFERIETEFEEMEKRQFDERSKFLHSRFETAKKGLLKLVNRRNLSVRKFDDLTMDVYLSRRTRAFVNQDGRVWLHWNGGYVSDMRGEEYKKVYEHLKKIYEERTSRKPEGCPF